MTAPARLLSVRLQGFKSFAERTHVAFGPGISAIVGPNGSGKSNLADALRWALGEQGRALRTRKSEDVIWAGSERRPALGMADVQLVLDNADGLLPVEFGVVELGRRLFRSGENEYVLNRQRVRLRDLVDLLDSAHLAENAFLFIGQGMVDQALALRPEERRPLFEEVAGVRRHERRRRRAEEQLAESEANLARVDDLVTELRPQVRRLAAQAEQQTSRRDAADELAAALLVAAHARWHAVAARVATADSALAERRAAVEAAMAELALREAAASGFADRLAERAAATAEARRELDGARERQTAARLASAAADGEVAAIDRERGRLAADRATIERDLATDRRRAALGSPAGDARLEGELREAESALAAATAELETARSAVGVVDAATAAARRADSSRAAELDLARRRQAELEREAAEEAGRAARAEEARDLALAAHHDATRALERATVADETARRAAEAADETAEAATAAAREAAARSSSATARLAERRDYLASVRARLEAEEREGLGAAARAAGGRRIADGLIVDPGLQAAVAAALGTHGAAFVVTRPAVAGLAGEHGSLVVAEALGGTESSSRGARAGAPAAQVLEAVRANGGDTLASAIRGDPTGAAARLLARAVWLPDLAACLRIQEHLPAGWIAVPRDGSAVVADAAVQLRPDQGHVARRAEADAVAREVADLEASGAEATRAADIAATEATQSEDAAARARAAAAAALEQRRVAEAGEAAAGRRAEAAVREAAWLAAQVDRLRGSLGRATESLATLQGDTPVPLPDGAPAVRGLGALEQRVAELRRRRDRLDASWRVADAERREAERVRTHAEAATTMGERRLQEIDAGVAGLVGRETGAARARAAAQAELESATSAAGAAGAALDALLALDAEDRGQLGGAERAAAAARDAVRSVQEHAREGEREELEARLGRESLREQLLVELAGLGELGLRHLGGQPMEVKGPADGPADEGETSADVARLEAALDAAAVGWARESPPTDAPSPGRLAALRRRFHELGAANPFALEEHAALSARLQSLESQRDDLLAAVRRTRELIAELDGLIAAQFRATFGALERAFDARFQQLFGGGFARLILTEPGDLATTGIEITARPPGKKAQALAMLSGGERALTAVALLFAMLEVRPVPFCVLDEVDAALDEANIGRFTDALRELAARTQFVVITHNRGTIETADALYGVTVGDDSVSRVISLRLEDAAAIADAAAAGQARAPIIPAGLALTEGVAEAAGEA